MSIGLKDGVTDIVVISLFHQVLPVLSPQGMVIINIDGMRGPEPLLQHHQKTKVIYGFEQCGYIVKLSLLGLLVVCPKCADARTIFKISSSLYYFFSFICYSKLE